MNDCGAETVPTARTPVPPEAVAGSDSSTEGGIVNVFAPIGATHVNDAPMEIPAVLGFAELPTITAKAVGSPPVQFTVSGFARLIPEEVSTFWLVHVRSIGTVEAGAERRDSRSA